MNFSVSKTDEHKLTVSVFEGLLLFGGLGDDFDPLAEEDADVSAVAVEHLDRQHEVLSLVGVGYVQGFGCAIILGGHGGERGDRGRTEVRTHYIFFCCTMFPGKDKHTYLSSLSTENGWN